MANDLIQRVTESVQDSMDEILANFKPGARITVLVRTPGKPSADFCMTDDDLDEVIMMVHRRKGEAPTTSPKTMVPADQIISQIEELFPNWRAYRDLVDCITCELHELRQRAEAGR